MLLYHPVFDPYHCSLRTFSLLSDSGIGQIEWDRLRVLDFLVVFPHVLKRIRLPNEYRSRRSILNSVPEPYEQLPSVTRVFYQVSEIQSAAMRLLAVAEFIDKNSLEEGIIRTIEQKEEQANSLVTAKEKLLYRSENWYAFITECLMDFPLNGNGGLKERTGLMEHRHDTV